MKKDTVYTIKIDNSLNLCTTFSEEPGVGNFRYKGIVKRTTTIETSGLSVNMISSYTEKCPVSDRYCLNVNSECTPLSEPVELGF